MCVRLRYTARRGRCGVPSTVFRTRSWRRTRAARGVFVFFILLPCLAGLARLAADALPGVADALALVRLRLPDLTDVRRDLAHQLLVDAAHVYARVPLDFELDPGRRRHLHGVRVANVQRDVLARLLRAIPDALQLERAREALRDADHHVVQERAREAVQRPHIFLIVLPRHGDFPVIEREGDVRREPALELALRALDLHGRAIDLDLDALRKRDRQFAYA